MSTARPGYSLAGWDPDQAYWPTDILTLARPATNWVKVDGEPLGWILSASAQ